MKATSILTSAAFAACLAMPAVLAAQGMNSTNDTSVSNDSSSSSTELAHVDKSFVMKAAKGGSEEVAISRVVLQRTTNPRVKDFAQKMIDDHTAANQDLMSLASSKSVKLPDKEIDTDKWSKKDASDLDKDYIDKMVDDHKDTVELFQKEADNGKDADIVAFARKTLPTIQEHLEHAEDLKRALKQD